MKKRPTAFRAAVRRTLLFAFVCWFCAMFLLTWAVAADMDAQVQDSVHAFMQDYDVRECNWIDYSTPLPGDMEANTYINMPLQYEYIQINQLFPLVMDRWMGNGYSSDDWIWGNWDLLYGLEPAAIFYDAEGNEYARTSSFMTFAYSEKPYSKNPQGRAYIDFNKVEGGAEVAEKIFGSPMSTIGTDSFLSYIRLTGRFEGNAFCPVTVDYRAIYGEWENIYSFPDTGNTPLQTVYGWDVRRFYFENVPVSANGERFNSLTELLGAAKDSSDEDYERHNLFDTVLIYNSWPMSDSYGDFTYSLAVRYHPVQYSMLRLWPVYLVSAAAAGIWVAWFLLRLKKALIDPIHRLSVALDYGYTIKPSAKWREICALEEHFADSRTYASETNAELQQLRTALDYAHNAEENRRQLVSDITHELKTPLAVIHSYAECLQENVVPEKREQYLSVILEETRHMDAMVLQMLDLSRLEAGKVRLASDTFSLLQLTKQTFEKFSPMLSGKNLRLYWQSPEDILLTADEARMTQAVTNLVSNAVKYTPVGGEITVKIFAEGREAHFSINNTAAHLSPEALEKVWDSFYRADPSRTEPGTGLGLALVKSIIQLHGGQCFVRNTSIRYETKTETGVEFGFAIPLP